MSKLPSYANKGEMTILVMMGTVTQLMGNAAKFYQDKGRIDWSRKLNCASTYIKNVMDTRYATLDHEQQKAHDRRYQKMNMYVSCNDTERFDPESQDDAKITVSTDDIYDLAEFAVEQCKSCVKTGHEIIGCKYREIMFRLCVPISDTDAECPFGDSKQNVKGAVDGEFRFLKTKI
jgi:hypothetical protein